VGASFASRQSLKHREVVVLPKSVWQEVLEKSASRLDQNNWVEEQPGADVRVLLDLGVAARIE
jgi:hypothetical protein